MLHDFYVYIVPPCFLAATLMANRETPYSCLLQSFSFAASNVFPNEERLNLDKETKFWTIADGQRKFNSAYTRGRIYDALHKLPETVTLVKVPTPNLIPFSKLQICRILIDQVRGRDPAMPEFNPTHLLLLYYAAHHGIGYHADSGANDGDNNHPIISVSLGNSCEFGMRLTKGEKKLTLASGDVVIWGGPQRMLSHSVLSVKPGSSPKFLNLSREVRLNFTFRDAPNILGREDEFDKFDAKAYSQDKSRKKQFL